jgi:hypothetical protein
MHVFPPTRSVTLIGQLQGSLWMPAVDATLQVVWDVSGNAARCGGLIAAIKSLVTANGGDFQNPLLSPDSEVLIEHIHYGRDGYERRTNARYIPVASLPSLHDVVALEAEAVGD